MHWAESREWQDCKAPEVPENRKHPSKIVKWGPKAEAEEVFACPQGAVALGMPLSIASLILLGSDTRGMNGMQLNGRGSSPLTGFAKQPLVKPLGLAKFGCCPIQNIKSTQALRTESKWYHHQYSGKWPVSKIHGLATFQSALGAVVFQSSSFSLRIKHWWGWRIDLGLQVRQRLQTRVKIVLSKSSIMFAVPRCLASI